MALQLKRAPHEPSDLVFPINLATALRLSDARPLIVAAAQASVWVAEAQLTRANVLWVPSVLMGVDYIRHDGGGPDFNKGVMTDASVNFFYAGPGLWQYVNLTDVIFEPLAARQALNSAHWDVQTAKNDALLQTADAYFLVHQYRGMYAGALYCVERGYDLIDRVANLARELVPADEVARARNFVAELEQRAVLARQEWRVTSANLTQLLRLDPRAVVEPLEHDHTQLTLINPAKSLDDLMPIALANRPEISSHQALVQAAEVRIRREKARPFLPLIMLNGFQSAGMYIQGGLFALGPNSSMNQWVGRDDVTIQVMWQLEGFGIGNLARIKNQRGRESRAIIELLHTQDRVAADVTRTLARLQSAAARVLQADRALRSGMVAFNGHLEGIEQTRRLGDFLVLTFRPQEAVYSLDLLSRAFNEYFTTVAEYNRAQFELFHALGYPAREIARFQPAGEVEPVDTTRPFYLPRVGNGPPPATR
jgi:outer membrane protein TolC